MSEIDHNIEAARRALSGGGPAAPHTPAAPPAAQLAPVSPPPAGPPQHAPVSPPPAGPPQHGRGTRLVATLLALIVITAGAAVVWTQLRDGDTADDASHAARSETGESGSGEAGGRASGQIMKNLVGQPWGLAQAEMDGLGLTARGSYQDGQAACSGDVEALITEQSPDAGKPVTGQTPTFVLDRAHGDGTVTVPNVEGATEEDAYELLTGAGLTTLAVPAEVAASAITAQTPEACAIVVGGSTVELSLETP